MRVRCGLVVIRPNINVPSERHKTYKSRFRYFNKTSQKRSNDVTKSEEEMGRTNPT